MTELSTDERFDQRLAWLAAGTDYLNATVDALSGDDVGAESGLPGWRRSHVLAHLARNADALGNLLAWARTGEPTPMYRDPEQRAADILAGARQDPEALRADYRSTAQRLAAAIADMPGASWSAEVKTARGRPIPAAEVPWMRVREVWVHAVDLATGAKFDDFPPELLAALIDDAVYWVARAENCPAVLARGSGSGREWRFGERGREAVVEKPLPRLAAWLTGREPGEPQLPPWL